MRLRDRETVSSLAPVVGSDADDADDHADDVSVATVTDPSTDGTGPVGTPEQS